MTTVSNEDLLTAVRNLRITLTSMGDEDTADSPSELCARIQDDHPMWKRGVTQDTVLNCLNTIKAGEIPPYVSPEETFPLDMVWTMKSSKDLLFESKGDPIGIHHAQGGVGSKGTYIIVFPQDQVMVLKESNPSFPAEVFAANLMAKAGLLAPKFRPLSVQEFKDFSWKLRSSKVTIQGTCSAIHGSSAQAQGGVLMDFLHGKTMPECDKSLLSTELFLKDLGRCITCDMLLNNLDRTPLIWRNKGNATNILVSEQGRLAVIDTTYNRIENEENASRHMEKIVACAKEAKSGVLGDRAEAMRAFFKDSAEVELTDDQLKILFRSIHEACQDFAENHPTLFAEAAKETQDAFEKSMNKPDELANLKKSLNLDFCTRAAMAMKQ